MSQIAWITGASTGIGKQLALALARQGWRVALTSRGADKLNAVIDEAEAGLRGRLASYPVDVTDTEAVRALAQRIEQELGPIGLCIFNAGDYEPMSLADFDVALFRRLMEVNYLGVINGMAAAMPLMFARRAGQILITASVAGYRGLPLAAPYGASKAALINMAESLRNEFAERGVRLRVINPGFVKTPLTAKNAFNMPALMTPEQAAAAVMRELAGDHFEITFPKRFTYLLKLLRCVPYRVYFPIIKRLGS